MERPYEILLYYNFVSVPDPEQVREEQEAFCAANNLKGRILVASEGINGTVSGYKAGTDAYKEYMAAHPLFHATEFKVDQSDQHSFLKLHVRIKDEIVRLETEVDVPETATNYIDPLEFKEVLKSQDEDILILDARSNYETEVGKFKNAVTLDIENFRDLPEALEQLEAYKDKKVYTYCTGGIKCEKVSELMRKKGFQEVYQLHGGIIRYAQEAAGEDFDGSCYVFDQRVVVPVNTVNPTVIGTCKVCDKAPTEQMINCANPECNAHFLICEACVTKLEGCCSPTCMENPRRRVFDGTGYYLRGVNSKNYVEL